MFTRQARANIHCHADSCLLSLPEAKQWYLKMVSFVSSCRTYAHERIVGVFYQLRIIYLIVRKHTLTQNSWVKLGVKTFHQGHLEFHNWLIFYYDTPHIHRISQLSVRVVTIKLIQVVIWSCHVYPLAGNIPEQIAIFRILVWFLWPMVNKEVNHFIRACTFWKLVNSLSREAQQMIHTIELDTRIGVVF